MRERRLAIEIGLHCRKMIEEFHACYKDPHYWISVITFTANWETFEFRQ
jgi:hypothetical protein